MGLRARLVLMVASSVSLGIVAVAAALTILAWRGIIERAEGEGLVLARALAQSAMVSEQVMTEVGALLDREMAAQGLLASHLADIADQAGLSERMLSRRLMEVTARSTIDELWISDPKGQIRAGATDEHGPTGFTGGGVDTGLTSDNPRAGLFGDNPRAGLFGDRVGAGLTGDRVGAGLTGDANSSLSVAAAAGLPDSALARLLAGTVFSEPLGVAHPPLGGAPMRYIGVRGVDSGRAVLVGREQKDVARLYQSLGVQRLLDAMRRDGTVEALWVFGPDGQTAASSASRAARAADAAPSLREMGLVQAAISGGPARAMLSGAWISVAAPMPDAYGAPAGAALARLSAAPLHAVLVSNATVGGLTAFAALLCGIALSVLMVRPIAAPMTEIAAAAAVDARAFVFGSLGPVAARRDELGHLARTFEAMARQVFAREEELERQVQARTAELRSRNEELDRARQRVEADLQLARLLQATILPLVFPDDRGWRGVARMTPALEMAGDFYDYFPLDAHRTAVLVADVSGKGVAPAFFMAVSRGALREAARHHDDPAACLAAANNRLCEQNPLDMFVTVFFAVIDDRNGTVSYCNGGHNQPYLITADSAPRMLPRTGDMALGVMGGIAYTSTTVGLRPGDTLFLYTDGVSEAMNPADEEFGDARLASVLSAVTGLGVNEILDAVTVAVQNFAGTAPQSDDITCLVVRYIGDGIQCAP